MGFSLVHLQLSVCIILFSYGGQLPTEEVCYILLEILGGMYVEGRGEEGCWHSGSQGGDEDRSHLVQYQSSPDSSSFQ